MQVVGACKLFQGQLYIVCVQIYEYKTYIVKYKLTYTLYTLYITFIQLDNKDRMCFYLCMYYIPKKISYYRRIKEGRHLRIAVAQRDYGENATQKDLKFMGQNVKIGKNTQEETQKSKPKDT